MPVRKPLLTKPRVMLATLQNRQGGLRVSWTGSLTGARWSSLLAMAAKRSPLASMAPRQTDQEPGQLTHRGGITTMRDESASVQSQTLIPAEPTAAGVAMTGFVSMPKGASAPSAPTQPKLPESIPIVVVVPRPPPQETPDPPPLPPRPRLHAKSPPPPLTRPRRQADPPVSPPPHGARETTTPPGPSATTLRPGPTTTQSGAPPVGPRPVPPPKRFGPFRRPVRALLSTAPLPLTGLGSSPQQPPTLAPPMPPAPLGVGPKPPRPPRPRRPRDVRGPVDAPPLPQTPEGSSSSPLPVTRERASATTTPPRLPPRITEPLRPTPPPRLGPTALGLASTQVGADRALGLVRRHSASLLVRSRRDPNRGPSPLPPTPLTSPQGLVTPQPRDRTESTPPQGLVLSPTDLVRSPTPTPTSEGFGSRLRAATLPLSLAPILSRGASPTQFRFSPELTTVVPTIDPVTHSPSPQPLPTRAPTLMERVRAMVGGMVSGQPPPPTIKTASEQLKEAHALSDRLDEVVKRLPKTVVGQGPTTAPTEDRTPGRTTGAEALAQAHELSDRLDKVTDSVHGSKPARIGLKRMARGSLLTPSALVLGSVGPPKTMRSMDRQVIVPEQVGDSPSSTPQAPPETGAVRPAPRPTAPWRSDSPTDYTSRFSPLEPYAKQAFKLAKRATAAWWPTWSRVPKRPQAIDVLTGRFARALYIADLRAEFSLSSRQRSQLYEFEEDEAADLHEFGSNLLLDRALDRPFKGEMPEEPKPKQGGLRGAVGSRSTALRTSGMGTPRLMRDTETRHTVIPDVPASKLDSGGKPDGKVGESDSKRPSAVRYGSSAHARYDGRATVLADWRNNRIDNKDFKKDHELARKALEDLNYEEQVKGKRPETPERKLRKKLTEILDSDDNAKTLDAEIDAQTDLRPAERVRWHRASKLGERSHKAWWPTWITRDVVVTWKKRVVDGEEREVRESRLQAAPKRPSVRSMSARYVRALEIVEIRAKPKRTADDQRRLMDLTDEEDAERAKMGSWLHLDLLLKRHSARDGASIRTSVEQESDDPDAPSVIYDDVEQIVLSSRKRSSDGTAPPRPTAQQIPPVPTPPPVPVEQGGLEPDAQSKLALSPKTSTAPPRPTSPPPTVDQLLSAMDENTLARLVQRVLDDKQEGSAVLARAIDLLERRARFGALREVR